MFQKERKTSKNPIHAAEYKKDILSDVIEESTLTARILREQEEKEEAHDEAIAIDEQINSYVCSCGLSKFCGLSSFKKRIGAS